MLCSILCSVGVLAAWGGKSVQRESGATQVSVQDGLLNNLGRFAGMVPVQDGSDLFRNAYLVISPQGYLLPVQAEGNVATAGPVYFKTGDCSGAGYVRASATQPVFTALPGAVFHRVLDDSLVYIPTDGARLAMTMHSFIDRKNTAVCTGVELKGLFYMPKMNDKGITGHDKTRFPLPITLCSADHGRSKIEAGRRQTGSIHPAGITDDVVDYQEECSPGCLSEDINNSICDIACWTPACGYDGGDCDALPQSELDEMLRSICSPGCFSEDLGDGFCDVYCNVELCNFDDGECVIN